MAGRQAASPSTLGAAVTDAVIRAAVNGFICTIAVDSIEDTERAVPEAGGEQVLDRMDVPDVGQLAYFKDTEGNIFGALQPVSG